MKFNARKAAVEIHESESLIQYLAMEDTSLQESTVKAVINAAEIYSA